MSHILALVEPNHPESMPPDPSHDTALGFLAGEMRGLREDMNRQLDGMRGEQRATNETLYGKVNAIERWKERVDEREQNRTLAAGHRERLVNRRVTIISGVIAAMVSVLGSALMLLLSHMG